MKPVSFYEIVVDQGEYLYRKGSNLSWTSAVLLVESRHRVLGVRLISSHIIGSHCVFHSVGLRALPRYRNAVSFQCVVSGLKVSQSSKLCVSDAR